MGASILWDGLNLRFSENKDQREILYSVKIKVKELTSSVKAMENKIDDLGGDGPPRIFNHLVVFVEELVQRWGRKDCCRSMRAMMWVECSFLHAMKWSQRSLHGGH